MVVTLTVGDQIRQTHIRFRNISNYEAYINSIDEGYDAEDSIFNGYVYKINTPQFNLVSRSQYGNGCDFKHEIIENRGNDCFIPTKGYCFVESINYLSVEIHKRQYLDFITNEKRGPNIMTKARIQPFCRANNIKLGYYKEDRVFPRSVTNRDSAFFLHDSHFCLIWKSKGVSFNQAIKDLKDNSKIVDDFITEKNVNSHFKYEFIPNKIESQWTIFIVYALETHNTDRARPYCSSFYRIIKLSGRCGRDHTREELDNCKNDTIVFDGDNCISNALDFC